MKVRPATNQSPVSVSTETQPKGLALRTSSGVSLPTWKITVNKLRSWADFFNVWKNRTHKFSNTTTISDDVLAFIKNSVSAETFQLTMMERQKRASFRIAGFQAFAVCLVI